MTQTRWKGNLTKHFTLEEYTVGITQGTCYLTEAAYRHAQLMEEFRRWLKREMHITSWYRTAKENGKVGGIKTSSHLKGTATDFHLDITITEAKFTKYCRKWKAICEEHGTVGEAGLYKWGMHLGSDVQYSKKFYHWDSRNGIQVNNPFHI